MLYQPTAAYNLSHKSYRKTSILFVVVKTDFTFITIMLFLHTTVFSFFQTLFLVCLCPFTLCYCFSQPNSSFRRYSLMSQAVGPWKGSSFPQQTANISGKIVVSQLVDHPRSLVSSLPDLPLPQQFAWNSPKRVLCLFHQKHGSWQSGCLLSVDAGSIWFPLGDYQPSYVVPRSFRFRPWIPHASFAVSTASTPLSSPIPGHSIRADVKRR